MKKMSGEREGGLASLLAPLTEAAAIYEAQFEQAKQIWDRNCREVDEVLERLAREHNGELDRWRDGTLSRAVTWYREGIGYSVSMLLGEEGEHPPLIVYSAVWQDDETSPTRTSVQLPKELIDTPVRVINFATVVNGLVQTLQQQSSLLRESPLPDSVRVSSLAP